MVTSRINEFLVPATVSYLFLLTDEKDLERPACSRWSPLLPWITDYSPGKVAISILDGIWFPFKCLLYAPSSIKKEITLHPTSMAESPGPKEQLGRCGS